MNDRKPTFEFIHYPEFGEAERANPATKIVYTMYSDQLTRSEMQEAFTYFLRACTYHIEDVE